MHFNILVLDDEVIVCNSLKRILSERDHHVFTATDMDQALQILASQSIDLAMVDLKLKETDGVTVLEKFKITYPELPVIIITAYGNIDIAVDAMKAGAYDFIQKNQQPEYIRFIVQRALDNQRLKKEVAELRRTCQSEQLPDSVISLSEGMQRVLKIAKEVAKSDSTVLITGETGTGKSLLARYIHVQSPRFAKPIVNINCSAIPHELIESELFGYEKGAFTGAREKGKIGLVERADGGTLFLDEIGELSMDLQAKILHVVEEGEFFRVGAIESTHVDNRIIAATNCDLMQLVEERKFRLDLFYRLNIASMHLPPLRERKEDILPLSKYFINTLNQKLNKAVTTINDDVVQYLRASPWNGNIRELRNLIERAMLLKNNDTLCMEDFAPFTSPQAQKGSPGSPAGYSIELEPGTGINLVQEAQRKTVKMVLQRANGNRSQAAKLLGIPRTTLNFYIQKYGLTASSPE